MLFDTMLILLGLAFASIVAVNARSIATRLAVMDHPRSQAHKAHAQPTPLVGGIACLPPPLIVLAVGALEKGMQDQTAWSMGGMAIAVALTAIVGFMDDRRHIPATLRLAICGTIFVALLIFDPHFVVQGINFNSFAIKFELGNMAIMFSAVSLLAFQNAVNMADGRNGLVIGLSIIWCLSLLAQGAHPSSLSLLVLLAGLLVTLAANLHGRLFLGDAGTYGIAAMIGLSTVWIHKTDIGLHTLQVVAMFIIPIFDMARLVFLRLINRQSPFQADHRHLHHYLDRAFGWSVGRWIYFALVIIPIVISHTSDTGAYFAIALAFVGYVSIIFHSIAVTVRRERCT